MHSSNVSNMEGKQTSMQVCCTSHNLQSSHILLTFVKLQTSLHISHWPCQRKWTVSSELEYWFKLLIQLRDQEYQKYAFSFSEVVKYEGSNKIKFIKAFGYSSRDSTTYEGVGILFITTHFRVSLQRDASAHLQITSTSSVGQFCLALRFGIYFSLEEDSFQPWWWHYGIEEERRWRLSLELKLQW